MMLRLVSAVIALLLIGGCSSMKPIDFKDSEPKLTLEAYFLGATRA